MTSKESMLAAYEAYKKRTYNGESNFCHSCNSPHLPNSCDIPDAPYYVCSNDTFFSGSGWADGRINVCVVPCADWYEVKKVMEYIENCRTDQKYLRVCGTKPRSRGRLLQVIWEWRENALARDIERGYNPYV